MSATTQTIEARGGYLHAEVDPDSLIRLHKEELDTLFEALDPIAEGQLRGALAGKLLAVVGLDTLPEPVRGVLHLVANSAVSPWKGKYFEGDSGSNLWMGLELGRRFGHFKVSHAPSMQGRGELLLFNYDVPENPAPLRAIRGEARALGPGLYLARMNYLSGSGHSTLLYFTLES